MYEETLRELGLFSLQKIKRKGVFVAVYIYLNGGYRKDSLFLMGHSGKKRDSGHDLQKGQFQSDIKEKKNRHESSQALEQVDQRVCGVAVLDDIQNLPGGDPKQLDLSLPCFEQGVGPGDVQRSLPT